MIDILVVGAGIAGLSAARSLHRAGHSVIVIDKGRGVGGRLASRRIGGAIIDHGAQFITARDSRFMEKVDEWLRRGIVTEWCRGFGEKADGHPRWRGTSAITSIAKDLALGIEVRLERHLVSLRLEGREWNAVTKTGDSFRAGAVILTPPVPQSLAILDAGDFGIPPEMRMRLERIEYERCLAVMAVLDGPSRVPPPGGVVLMSGPISWIADNQTKGISALPAVTIHGTDAFSREQWDHDRQESGRQLLQAAEQWLGSPVREFQVHGWGYSKPVRVEPGPCLIVHRSPPLLLAGDAFAEPRVEGAALSGWAAAETLSTMVF